MLFSATWSGTSARLRTQLARARIAFEDVDVDTKRGRRLVAEHGVRVVPTVLVLRGHDATVVLNPGPEEVRRALGD